MGDETIAGVAVGGPELWAERLLDRKENCFTRNRGQAYQDFEQEKQKHSSVNSYSMRNVKAKHEEEIKKLRAVDERLRERGAALREWFWLMKEIVRLLIVDCYQGTACFSVATFVARCSRSEKRQLLVYLDQFGYIVDWENTDFSLPACLDGELDPLREAVGADVQVAFSPMESRKYREYPPLPPTQLHDLDHNPDPRPRNGADYDPKSTFGEVWEWWMEMFHEHDIVHYRTDGTWEDRAHEFWRRYREQKVEEAAQQARKLQRRQKRHQKKQEQKQRNVPGMEDEELSSDGSNSSSNSDDEDDINDVAQRLQHTQVTDSHLTGASSVTRHKRTYGRKKGGNAKKKGKKGKK